MRPRLALIPSISPLEWRIRPALESWADVTILGEEIGLTDELEARGWPSCFVAGDEWGVLRAVAVAEDAPDRVLGLALGHACLYEPGARARDVEPEIWEAYKSLARMDYRSFARALTQVSAGSYDDEIVESFLETVPHERMTRFLDAFDQILEQGADLGSRLRALGLPTLLARHEQCLLWTGEGFEAAREALPEATCVSVADKPSVSGEFEEALREFCTAHAG
jgi:pimeloyl-ACP methyl ester carboxylesterase